MVINRFSINAKIFDEIIYDYEYFIENRNLKCLDELMKELKSPNANTKTIYYDELNQYAIIPLMYLEPYELVGHTDHYMQKCLIIRDENVANDTIYIRPYAKTCVKYINEILYKSGYTDAEIDECLNKCSVNNHNKPIHSNLPYYYEPNVIHEIHNCVYYDINNAHLDALCEIYPKAKRRLENLRIRINRAKEVGDYNSAQFLKDIVNIYCGNLGRKNNDGSYNKHRGTYEWIVARTRAIIEEAIECVGGTIIYANTDGFIATDPSNLIVTSNKLGDFKSEISNDTIYAYVHVDTTGDTTGYILYQYINAKGKVELKGSIPCQLRDDVDLSTGQIITYKKHMTDKGVAYYDNVNKNKREIVEWD